jgi:diguanylate cyclase (GGDEF)-like protein/PAS domain S-box-containing protein
MTLRGKTITIVAAALITLMAMLYISSRAVLLHSFAQLEEEATRTDVRRALNTLENRIAQLDTTAYDWASWDDTYQFMQDMNDSYLESNLLDDTLLALSLNAVVLVAPGGEVVFQKAIDLETEDEIAMPQGLSAHLTSDGLLSPEGQPGSRSSGILQLPAGFMLVSSRPILTSADEGPMQGWLIMARYLDSTEVERLAEITDSVLTIERFDGLSESAAPGTIQSALLDNPSSIAVRPMSAEVVAGYAVIPDIYGAPSLLLGVEVPREIYAQGQAAVNYLLTAILLVGLAFGGLQCVMLDRQVLARIMELSTGITRIRSHDDLSARVTISGQDELSELGIEINSMLQRLQDTQADLKRSEQRFRSMADNVRDGLTIVEDGKVTYVNDRACEIFGYPRHELMRIRLEMDLAAPEERKRIEPIIELAEGSGEMPPELDFWTVGRDGSRRYISNRYAFLAPDGRGRNTYVVTTDLTRRKAMEDELQRDKERLEILLEEFPLGVAIITADQRYEYLNPKFVEMFGYTKDDVPTSREWFEKAYPDEAYRRQVISTSIADLEDARPGEARPRTFTVRCKNNAAKVIHFRPVTMEDGGQFMVCEDITERQRAEDSIRQLAYHDPLTGLPNRILFNDRVEKALAHARRNAHKLAVLLMDLDHFKEVNDNLGHTTGDQLLQAVGERLTALLRDTDTICRMGGDEFLILLTGITEVHALNKIAFRILEAIRVPFVLDDHTVKVTTSLGGAIYPDDAEDVETLIRQTDFAMYLAKERGRDNYQRYSPFEHETRPASVRSPRAAQEALGDGRRTSGSAHGN